MSMQELFDAKLLQKIQNEFYGATGMLAYCIDNEKNSITEVSGGPEEKQKMEEMLASAQVEQLIERVEQGSLEDLAIEALDGGEGRVAAMSVKVKREVILYWIVVDLNGEEKEQNFEAALDLLHDASIAFFHYKLDYLTAEVQNQKNEDVMQEIGKHLETIEATAEIIQLLDSSAPINEMMVQWLKIVSEYLNLDTAQIFRVYEVDSKMDVMCQWHNKKVVPFFDKTSRVETYPFLLAGKTVVMSSDAMREDVEGGAEYLNLGIRAVMIFPLMKYDNVSNLMVSLNYRTEKNFATDEIKFASDAVKILQSALTSRKQKDSILGSYNSLEAILDNVGSCLYVLDPENNKVLFGNRKLRNTFAKELREGTFQSMLLDSIEQGHKSKSQEVFLSVKDGWYDISYRRITWVDGRKVVIYALYDITDRKVYQRRIEQQAYTDFLTGLYNRMCCERDLARQIDEAKKNAAVGALLYMDLDDFKHINDGLGHQYGDVLLKAISHALQRIKGIEDTCYRMGGDEFVIIVPPEYYADFDRIVEEIKLIFSRPWFLKDADYYCTMSMGIVTFPDLGETVQELVKKADIAMYEAKKGGKNRISTYSDDIFSASGRRLDMERNMRDATVKGYEEFQVYYQPIINVQKEEIECAGAEALIRWNSSKFGFIAPAEFIPLAEYLGLINPIGNFVLKEACTHCKDWNDRGYPNYKVNVNLSVVQLLQPDIVDIVAKTLKETGLNPQNLTLEVTESLAINDMERMKEILNGIKNLGVKLALDDFGTGYSSLNHIREIPFDVIKVDQSFVKDLAQDAYAKSFVKMVSELAEAIGVSICVEGIETINQYAALEHMKIKYVQGFFFDRPMPREAFEAKYVQ